MQKHEEKLKRGLGLGKMKRIVLRLLRADAKFPLSSIEQEKSAHAVAPVNVYHDSQREIRNALLNAECKKAEALMEWQKRRFIC
ncbi:hypothetical protein E3J74_04330 [Candidatus Bathyarchaeota archaeon]|nr:MAG: hypothetical protein E3J74_04330 [Candidatus Bathyarchaeota archaeon]